MPSITVASITASMDGVSQKTSASLDDTSLKISPTNIYAVVEGPQTLNLSADNVQAPEMKPNLQWKVLRNDTESTWGGATAPDIEINSNDHSLASLHLNIYGSFNVIVYVDKPGGTVNNFDPGEQLRVLHLAIVKVQLNATPTVSTLTTHGWELSAGNPGSVTTSTAAITFSANVALLGGGEDKTLGTSRIFVGWLGNFTDSTYEVSYAGGNHSMSLGYKGASLPLLDTSRDATNGGNSAFRFSSTPGEETDRVGGGKDSIIQALDKPSAPLYSTHVFNGVSSTAEAVSGNWYFTDYLDAVSSSFPKTYPSFYSVQWMWGPSGTFDGVNWTNSNSLVEAGETTLIDGTATGVTTMPTISSQIESIWN
jgi:hypothetical protein